MKKQTATYKDAIKTSVLSQIDYFGIDEINNVQSQKMLIEIIYKNFSFLTIEQFLPCFYCDERIVKHF